ncbi:hypothetical protein OHT57_46930 [Streptomyces sp. NBC_00285]|uniref:hypothetical protein n=1 Tax=Streptomyces sp. NBC_00285 TaxID=2975700 RepID=UPI002E2D0258|nr:hypothetical protein [Streptomyces sp. NBC_00285]
MLADLGRVQLKRGNTTQALPTGNEFLNCADSVQSFLLAFVRASARDWIAEHHGDSQLLKGRAACGRLRLSGLVPERRRRSAGCSQPSAAG